jgi:hypothetical protein
MENDVQIDFQLLGTIIPPKEISRITGIVPDVELMQGERNKKLNLPRVNIWSIRSTADSDEVEDHWISFGETLTKSKEEIKNIAATGVAKLTLVINSNQRIPSIIIPPAMSEFAGFIGAVIDIDHTQ